MRIRIAAPVLVGALTLAALAAPTAACAATATGAPVITGASATTMVLGLTGRATQVLRISATDAAGIKSIRAIPWPEAAVAKGYKVTAAEVASSNPLPAVSHTATTETAGLTDTMNYNVEQMHIPNALAGSVYDIAVLVTGKNGKTTFTAKAGTFSFKRADTLNAKASATTVRKGSYLTVNGQLTRANWDRFAWQGYASRWVALQFRTTGTSTWNTVTWVRSTSSGAVTAAVRDYRSGTWRFVYAGDTASGATASAATWVTVK
ncbi:hypothetical protein ABIA32_006635 [Streptacidiphilus sp. MAP12-20]|uniref:hypothetical protein n=1 Tax=Streptacidiphilus sp. MAP12-20 TaxID=3156299 RepID=UPI0035134665